MKNIKDIGSFLPNPTFVGLSSQDLIPIDERLNEALGDGINLDGKTLSEVQVSDWIWDFGVEKKEFPKGSVFTEIMNPDEDLSVFMAQMVNTFAVQAWKSVKSKKLINASISEIERKKMKSKLRGFFGGKKKLEQYKQEKENLAEFIVEFEKFLLNGELGATIQENADSIVLTKTADVTSGSIQKIVTNLKSFFSKSSWQRAIMWLVSNVSNNDQYVKWLDTTVYEENKLSSGISPGIESAFNSFIIDAGLNAGMPDMENAMPAIKKAAKLVISKSKELPKQGTGTWMGCLYNTHLFGLYQRMLIIGCCAWVYDLIGDTDIMMTGSKIGTAREEPREKPQISPELEVGEHNGIKVYMVSYLSKEFKGILDSLLTDGQIGKNKYDEYMARIDSKKESRSTIRSVRMDVLGWCNRHGFKRTDRPEVKGLYTDGSTRLIIPIEIYNKIVGG